MVNLNTKFSLKEKKLILREKYSEINNVRHTDDQPEKQIFTKQKIASLI